MNAANIYIGSMLILVSTVILSINTYILLLIGRNYRFATFKNPTSSSGVNGQRNQPKGPYILHHLPTCYFLSLSACFALRLLLTVVHNGPTLIMDDLFAGASVSGLAGWLYKCSYYGAIGHVIVLCIHKYTLLSGYKKRQRRNKGKRHVIFGSRFRMRFITFLIWLPPILISTVIKMKLCEWQFSPQHLTYECVEIITKNLGYNQQNTWPQTETLFNIQIESTKILKIIDTIILILCSLICMFCVIRVLVLSKKRTRQVTQIQLSVSVVSSSSNQAFPNRNFASSTNVNIVKANRHIRQLIAICFIFLVANFLDVCLNLLNLDRKSVNLAHYIWTNLIYSFMLPFLFTFYSKHRLLQNGFMRLSKSGLGTEVKRKASFAGSNTSNGTINWGGGAIKKYKSPFSNIMSSRSPSPSGQKHESGDITSISTTDHHSPRRMNVERLSRYQSSLIGDQSPQCPPANQTSTSNLFVPQNYGSRTENSLKDQQSSTSNSIDNNDPKQIDNGTFNCEQLSSVDFIKKNNLLERRSVDQKRLPPIRLNAFEMEKIGSSQDESPTPDIIKGQNVLTHQRRKRLFMGPVQANISQESAETIFQLSRFSRKRTAESQSLATCLSPAESLAVEKFTDTLSKYNPPLFIRNENFQRTDPHRVFVKPSVADNVNDYSLNLTATNTTELERKMKKSRHFMNGFLTND